MSEIRAVETIEAAEIMVEEAMEVAGLRGGYPGPPPAWMDPPGATGAISWSTSTATS